MLDDEEEVNRSSAAAAEEGAVRGAFVPERGTLLSTQMRYYDRLLTHSIQSEDAVSSPMASPAVAEPSAREPLLGPAYTTDEMLADPRNNEFDRRKPRGNSPELKVRRLETRQDPQTGAHTHFRHFAIPPPHVLPPGAFIFGTTMDVVRSRTNSMADLDIDFSARGESNLGAGGEPEEIVVEGTQSSIVTIFSIWSAMMGASMLSIPYGFEQAGIIAGISCVCVICALSYYTCWLIIKYGTLHGELDFADVSRRYLGRVAQWLSLGSSVLVLSGGCIAFITLLSNSLFKMGKFFQCWAGTGSLAFVVNSHAESGPCNQVFEDSSFSDWWSMDYVPIMVSAVVFPLTNVREVTPLLKLTSFGVVFMSIIVSFIIYGSARALIALHEGHDEDINKSTLGEAPPLFQPRFFYLLGICDVAFFIHNAILPMTAKAKHPENVSRDVGIAFGLVALTYSGIGTLSYVAFWDRMQMIPQDFIHMFPPEDVAALVARLALFLQLIGLYPLLLFVIRIQIFGFILKTQFPHWGYVLILNILMAVGSTLFAIFYPNIGTLFRFVGAFAAFLYVFCFPVVVHLLALRAKGQLSKLNAALHSCIVVFGIVTLVWQFF